MNLSEVAEVMIGVLTKREKEANGENIYLLFSLKSFEDGTEYEELKTNKDLSSKIAKQGDLLFRLLYPNKIIYVDKSISGKLVSSQFCIIRPKLEIIDPIILKWYLESSEGLEDLTSKITGSIIKTIPVAKLKTIYIPEISKEKQEKIKKVILLSEKEIEIEKKLLEEKEKLYNLYIKELVYGGNINGK